VIGRHFTQWPLFPCWGKDGVATKRTFFAHLICLSGCQSKASCTHFLKAYGPGAITKEKYLSQNDSIHTESLAGVLYKIAIILFAVEDLSS